MISPFKRKRQAPATSAPKSSRAGRTKRSASFKQPQPSPPGQTQPSKSLSKPPLIHRLQPVYSERSSAGIPPPPGNGSALGERVLDDSVNHIIMAIDIKERDTVGCAYYIAQEERLLCMEDVVGGGKEAIESLQIELKPTVVLMSIRVGASASETEPHRMLRHTSLLDNDDDHPSLPYVLEIRPNAEFGFENATNKLVNLEALQSNVNADFLVPGDSITYDDVQATDEIGLTNRQGRIIQASALLNLDSRVGVGCVGVVITCLQRKRASEYLQDDPDAQMAYRVQRLEMFSIRNSMLINADTLSSLHIIQPESHPNAFNQGPGTSGAKESLSIYGLFHHLARTPQGRVRLRRYFLRPSLDIDEISARLDFVSVFTRPDNQLIAQKLNKSLSRIKNMRSTLTLLRKGVNGGNRKLGGFKSGVWASLLEFCYHAIDVADALNEVVVAEHLPLKARSAEMLDKFQLQRIGKMVHDVVDLELSTEQHRTVVKHEIDENLDRIKEMYDGMDVLLTKEARQIMVSNALNIDINVTYFPQLGFHITVPLDPVSGEALYSGGDTPWRRVFTTENQVYFKDDRMHELDEQLGDLYAIICDIEIELSYDLAQRVLLEEKLLIDVSDLCGEIDCLLALALGALQHKLTRPLLTAENVIDIKGGRHLLQEMIVSSYVPNDTFIVGGPGRDHPQTSHSQCSVDIQRGSSMLLLTGPNYSGKSIYQKQVALAVYMAHIGSFVPADSARIGLTDKILTRIATRETVSKMQSAFMIDLQQISLAINHASPRSLVVIDEFGKGTDSCDGAGLAAGVFGHFLALGPDSPKVLAATHFHEIFDDDFLQSQPNVALAHMEVRVDEKGRRYAGDHNSEIIYLYNLKAGRSMLSYGTQCAAMNGIPEQVVIRATELAELVSNGEDLVAICSTISADEADDLEDAEACSRAFLGEDLSAEGGGLMEMLESVLGESASGSMTLSRSRCG